MLKSQGIFVIVGSPGFFTSLTKEARAGVALPAEGDAQARSLVHEAMWMNLQAMWTALRIPHAQSQMLILRDLKTFLRLHFLYAALDLGLLAALEKPTSKWDLIQRLHIERPDLFGVFLDVGVALRELAQENGLYWLIGRRSRALNKSNSLASLLQEYVTYHAAVYQQLASRLAGAPLGDYLNQVAEVIAQSSQTYEPFIRNLMRDLIKTKKPARYLDVGCGLGFYLRLAAEMDPHITGLGIDMHAGVVQKAQANLAQWRIQDRFNILEIDIRQPHAALPGPFDFITLFNNTYYFTSEDRRRLFRTFRLMLGQKGTLLIASSIREGHNILTVDFDLTCQSTVGCGPLPRLDEITLELQESGFSQIRSVKLLPLEPYYAIVAH